LKQSAFVALAAIGAFPLSAQLFHRQSEQSATRAPAITLRKRVHVNTLITAPDTFEIEWGSAISTDGSFTLPTTIHFTPEGTHPWWGRTEFSASFDSLSSSAGPPDHVTHFGDRVGLAATCVVHDGEKLDIAFAPQVSMLMRGDEGVRAGATAIARYDIGRSSTGVTITWTAANRPTPSNPAATLDIGFGSGFRLKSTGLLSHLTPHFNTVYERSTGVERQISLFEGVEYQIVDAIAVDFSAQHLNVWGGQIEHQVVIGLTVNTGRLHPQP
jgi:hypothetical protein